VNVMKIKLAEFFGSISLMLFAAVPLSWAQPPAAPTDLTATVLHQGAVALYWHDRATNESGFKIERKEEAGLWMEIARTGVNSTSFNRNGYVDVGVDTAAKAYVYRLRAFNSLGHSSYSNEAVEGSLQPASGFDYPVGDVDGLGGYTNYSTGTWCANGWYVYRDVADPLYPEHTGEDWNGACSGNTDRGEPVYAAAEGRVVYSGYVPASWGHVVLIAHKLPGGEVFYSQYAHLEYRLVRAGDAVVRRQEIGAIGKAPVSNAVAHLHFEIRRETVPAGHWPKTSTLIGARYLNPTNRARDKSGIVGFTGTSFIDANRNLWSAPPPTLRIDGGLSSSKAQGQTFYFTGTGYTPDSTVTRRLTEPSGNVTVLSPTIPADPSGNISWAFPPSCSSPLGTYTLRAMDDSNGRWSNEVTEVITAGACASIYQAEDAMLTWPAKFNNDHSGYSGRGFVDGYGFANGSPSVGATTTFSVWVPTSGNYRVALQYANATGGARSLSVYVNNAKVQQTVLVNFANWDTWGSRAETLYLWAGWNTVAFRYDSGDTGNVNLDFIQVSP